MQRYQLIIHHELTVPSLWTEQDQFIMRMISNLHFYGKKELMQINEECMHLRVMTLADILTIDGRRVRLEILQGIRIRSHSSTAYRWPNAAKPTSTTLRIWKQAIKRILNIQDNNLLVRGVRLGRWFPNSTKFFQWWYHEGTKTVYRIEEDHEIYSIWEVHLQNKNTRSNMGIHTKTTNHTFQIDRERKPVDVLILDQNSIRVQAKGTLAVDHDSSLDEESIGQLGDFWATRYVNQFADDGQSYAQMVANNYGKIVCDGSFKDGITSAAFVTLSNTVASGGNIVPGSKDCQSSYRGELGGLLGAIMFTKYVCAKWEVQSGSVTIGCDCKGALALVRTNRVINSQWNSYDLLSRITKEIKKSGIIFQFVYVQGHQDSKKKWEDLDDWEMANVHADLLAKQYLAHFGLRHKDLLPERDKDDMWTICYRSEMVVCNIHKVLYEKIWAATGKSFWLQRLHLPAHYCDNIAWDILGKISSKLTYSKRQRYIKVMANIAPVGTTLYRRGAVSSPHCPLCQQCEEDNMHIWRCSQDHIVKIFDTGCASLALILFQGPDPFRSYMMTLIMNMRSNARFVSDENTNDISTWQQALQLKTQLGINSVMWGFFHTEVVKLVEAFFEDTRIVAKHWLSKVTLILWSIYDEMWYYRNSVKHEKGRDSDPLTHEMVDQEISNLFNAAPPLRFLMVSERRLLAQSAENVKNKPLKYKRKWIRDAEAIITKFNDNKETVEEVKLFRKYFGNKRARYSDEVQTMDLTKDGG